MKPGDRVLYDMRQPSGRIMRAIVREQELSGYYVVALDEPRLKTRIRGVSARHLKLRSAVDCLADLGQ